MNGARILGWLLVAVVVGPRALAADGGSERISVAALRERGAVGDLELPLGTIATVVGTAVSGDSLKTKAAAGRRYLRVEQVDGRVLRKPVLMRVSGGQELLPGEGKPASLIVYETGEFTGAPDRLFDHVEAFATVGFSFESSLVIVKAGGKGAPAKK